MTYLHQPYIFQVLSASSTWDRIVESITPNTYDIQTWDIFFVTTEINTTESQQTFAQAVLAGAKFCHDLTTLNIEILTRWKQIFPKYNM